QLTPEHDCSVQMLKAQQPLRTQTASALPRESTQETLRHMVVSILSIAMVPESTTTMPFYDHQVLTIRPVTHTDPKHTLALAWRASFPRHQAVDAVREAILASSPDWSYSNGQYPDSEGILVDNKNW